MKRLLCPQLPKPNRPVALAEDEANHAVRVLRLRDGDSVEAIDGQGHSAPAILRVRGGPPRLELAGGDTTRTQAPHLEGAVVPLTLEMAILKGDAMEWVVEKAVELGVRKLVPVLTAHTVVQIKGKGPEAFRDRWQKIADQALKQCGRLERMEIASPIELEQLEGSRLWCDEAAVGTLELGQALAAHGVSGTEEMRLLIGPEGGWSEAERQWLTTTATRVALGPLVLRAETAALYATSLIVSAWRDRQNASNRLTKKDG